MNKEIEDFTEQELNQMAIDLVPVLKLRNEHAKFKQALNEIREYIKNTDCCTWDNTAHEDILKIIDKVRR